MNRPSFDGTRPDDLSARRQQRRGPEGEVEVFGSDEQNAEAVDVGRWVALARDVLIAEGVRGEAELSLLFVDEDAIADLNHRFMDETGPTDVLAFPIDERAISSRWPDAAASGPDRDDYDVDDLPLLLGDVVVCPAVAARQAPEHDSSYEDELALLVVHGVLHVLGHDHAAPDEAAAMRERERDLLQRFHHRS